MKSCFSAQLPDVISAVDTHIALSDKVGKGHLDRVAEPAHCCGIHGHITKHKSSAGTKHTAHAIKEVLWVWVMVEALTADHHIE